MKKFSKLMAAVLALVLCLSLLPMAAFAAEDCGIGHHDWKYVTTKEPTCTEWGEKVSRCTKCGKDQPLIAPMPIRPNGHTWEFVECKKALYTSLCTADHQDLMRCKTCGVEEVQLNSHGHIFDSNNVFNPGDVSGKDIDVWHSLQCSKCTGVRVEKHTYVPATCTAPETCSGCHHVKSGSKALGHAMTYHAADNATCTTDGNIEYWSCSSCGKNFRDEAGTTEVTDVTIAAGHKLTLEPEKAATCMATGTKAHYVCSVCQAKFQDVEGKIAATADWLKLDIDPENHAEGCKLKYQYLSNGTANGEQHWKEWSLCHTKVEGSYENHQYHEGERECYVCGYNRDIPHTHVYGAWTVDVAPTEDTAGLAKRSCECGDEQTMTLPALGGREWSYVATRSTCDTHGVGTYTYTFTYGEEDPASVSVSVELPLDRTNHVGPTEVRGAYASTATTDGYTGNTYCTRCNGLISTGNILPATGTGDIQIDDPEVPLASGPVTRAQFIDYLWRHEGEPALVADSGLFEDVTEEHEFSPAMAWAKSVGIIEAYEDGTFEPDELVTVGAVRSILANFARVFGTNAVAAADLTTLTGDEDEAVLNCDEVLAEFFGEEYTAGKDEDIEVAA